MNAQVTKELNNGTLNVTVQLNEAVTDLREFAFSDNRTQIIEGVIASADYAAADKVNVNISFNKG